MPTGATTCPAEDGAVAVTEPALEGSRYNAAPGENERRLAGFVNVRCPRIGQTARIF